MRAVVLRAPGTPPAVEDVRLDAPKHGELLVRIEAAGVCHSDLHYMSGELVAPLPLVLGHEGCGVVERLGPDPSGRVAVGDRVALLWRPRCGECAACLAGNPALCEKGGVQASAGGLPDGTSRLCTADGGELHHLMGVSCFAERVVVSESAVVPVPDGVPPEVAAISACAVVTGIGAVLNVVERAAGSGILIVGAGGVGLSSVMGAHLVGANPIIVADIDEAKLELARELGATHVIVSRTQSLVDEVMRITNGAGVSWAIEAVGRLQTLEAALECVAAGGTLVAIGLGAVDTGFTVPLNQLVQRQKRIVGSLYGSANPPLDLPRIFRLYLDGRLPLDRLIGERMPLENVNRAYDALIHGAVGRGILVP
jgi:Zn-dependent alcohol dehydrogenase